MQMQSFLFAPVWGLQCVACFAGAFFFSKTKLFSKQGAVLVRPSSVVAVGPSLGANGGPRELSGLASGSLWAAGGLQMVPKEGPDSYLAWPRDLSGRSRTPKRAGQIAFLVRPSSVVDVGCVVNMHRFCSPEARAA